MDFTSSYAMLMGKSDYAQAFRIKNAADEMRWLSEDVHVKKIGRDRWRLLGVCMDITDRKKIEDSLRDSEQRYKRLIDLSPDAITVHTDGKIAFVNPAGVKLVGRQATATWSANPPCPSSTPIQGKPCRNG